ncbi:unnamed protein product [Lactuca virosa]|uniref:Uncharacterized protein n=1 Tax=Lactuca virosa TaxID=75947 RepID=A0AAU9NBM6_9ASTR|nr:unnamed protein product [Lactuca virosa]
MAADLIDSQSVMASRVRLRRKKRKGKEAETLLNTGVSSTLLTSDHRRRPSSPIQVSEVIGLPLTMSFLVLYPGFPLVQTKIIDFFRIQRSSNSAEEYCQDIGKKRRRKSYIAASKKRRRLLPYSPSEDPARRLEQMASLATALTATEVEFSNELTYIHGMAPRSANRPAYEKEGMQVLSKKTLRP